MIEEAVRRYLCSSWLMRWDRVLARQGIHVGVAVAMLAGAHAVWLRWNTVDQ